VEFQLPVGAEHRHAFLQDIQRRRLHLLRRLERAFQRQPFADIFIEIGDAARRMRLADHLDGLAVRQVPLVLAMRAAPGVIERQPRLLPALPVALLRQLAAFAQPVQHFAVGWMLFEETFRQAPQKGEGAVVEGQFLVAAEYRHRRLQLVQRVGMGVDMSLQPRFGAGKVGDIDGGADDAGIAQRNLREGQGEALAAHDGETCGLDDAVLAAGAGRKFALVLVQRALGQAQLFQVGSARAFQEGVVAPGDSQGLVAQPDRRRQGIEDGLVVGGLGGDGRLFQPYRHHAAHGAATGNQLAAMRIGHRNLEGGAAIRQAIDRSGQAQRIGPLEAGLQQLLAAAIGIGSRPVPAPDHERFASRAQQGVALAHGGFGAGAGQPQRTAQAAGDALLRQGPEPGGDGQRDAARGQGRQHHDLAGKGGKGIGGQNRGGERRAGHEQADRHQPPYAPAPRFHPVSHFGTSPPLTRRRTANHC